MARSPQPPSLADDLHRHIAALEAENKALLAEQLKLEEQGTAPKLPPTGPVLADRVQLKLNGYASTTGLGMSGGQRLRLIQIDREAIRLAIGQLEQQRLQAAAVERAAEAKARTPAWNAANKRVLLLEREFAAAEAVVAAMAAEPCGQWLPNRDIFGTRSVLGVAWINDPTSRVRGEAIKRGIVSEAELREATRNV